MWFSLGKRSGSPNQAQKTQCQPSLHKALLRKLLTPECAIRQEELVPRYLKNALIPSIGLPVHGCSCLEGDSTGQNSNWPAASLALVTVPADAQETNLSYNLHTH